MALIMQYMGKINSYLNKYEDPRTSNWLFMSSPFYTLGICLSYVFIVKVLGPKIMENRKPFQLKNTLIAYNLFQVIFSTWLFYQIGMSGWLTGEYSLSCQPVDYSNKPSTLNMVSMSWWYYFSKFTEFFDTIFFVLRKKFDHVSTLHVIHHGIMPMSVWFGVKFTPGGHSTFFGFLNSFVHIVMYTYYLLSALGPKVQKYLWWKKYLTTLQMIQFVGIMVHAFQLLFIDCDYPRAFVWWIGMHAVMFFFLFREFYNQTYSKRKKAAMLAKAANGTSKQLNGEFKQNGEVKLNGTIKQNGEVSVQNGHAKENGFAKTNANEYYINATSEIHHRIKTQ